MHSPSEIRETVPGWLQVNLILDGSWSSLKYLVNRFRSSTYPGSLQTFDSLRAPLSFAFTLSPPCPMFLYPPLSRSPVPPALPPAIYPRIARRRIYTAHPLFHRRFRYSFKTKRTVRSSAVQLAFKSISIRAISLQREPR